MPFQSVLRRFRRRHDIAEAQEAIEMVPNVFDILYLDGETLIDLPFSERRKRLESVVTMYLAPQVVSSEQARDREDLRCSPRCRARGDHDQGALLALYARPAGKELDQDQAGGGHARPCGDRRRMGRGEAGPCLRLVPRCLPGPGKTRPPEPGRHRVLRRAACGSVRDAERGRDREVRKGSNVRTIARLRSRICGTPGQPHV